MFRVVLGVALAVALVAAVVPALEDARAARTERLTERELDRVEAAAVTLAREESPGARRTLSVSLPGDPPTATPVLFVALGGLPGNGNTTATDTAARDVLAYSIAGGDRHVRRVETDLRVGRARRTSSTESRTPGGESRRNGDGPSGDDSRALVLRGGEDYEVTLRLVSPDGRRTVAVSLRPSSSGATRGTVKRGHARV
ncbi:hypothetical protein [Halorussus sp. MSC15.2]|uniref:DUF7311 family protein n=1 Tax=Halorussus sp. MSC15.2 TaxID=2283638 RepID=UPI0013D681A9|nr:hypothetical protein [Halorussus sp. MSC15.2]NEU57550.1 hypothetical protein [Halorussus sp. MSC15.2]